MIKSFLMVFILCTQLVLSGCSVFSGPDEPEPVLLAVTLNAGKNINPSKLSEANPVVIRIYQLKSIDTFKSAQVLDLFQQDATILADSLIQKQVLASLVPKEKRNLEIELLSGTKYLAVFVQFSNYSQAKTKAWLDVSKFEDIKNINVSIDSLTINMQEIPQESFWSW
ncbi:type VI secretion system lipoprotein TssJ [Pseudoalteromonas denitrificans]|uniref:Type VI secretion system protein VasD n=1 Tax=Pseudoalteromonas denitrificans DSM 6059 TaxID=1123010 RepID=A0A1I1GM19_9GAMM|nr:type VI secretion system lipoprotein TssJ [Pseudoalteromonas denitrificans]SFC12654.1 type VI secretion system protein VasD [Pseudoalteromonas denitrificans DSM 6059]